MADNEEGDLPVTAQGIAVFVQQATRHTGAPEWRHAIRYRLRGLLDGIEVTNLGSVKAVERGLLDVVDVLLYQYEMLQRRAFGGELPPAAKAYGEDASWTVDRALGDACRAMCGDNAERGIHDPACELLRTTVLSVEYGVDLDP